MRFIVPIIVLALVLTGEVVGDSREYDRLRAGMVMEIQATVRDTSAYIGKKALAETVMNAMAEVPGMNSFRHPCVITPT